jgi:hypothetical protein
MYLHSHIFFHGLYKEKFYLYLSLVVNADLQTSKKSTFPKRDTVFCMKASTVGTSVILNAHVLDYTRFTCMIYQPIAIQKLTRWSRCNDSKFVVFKALFKYSG